MHVFFSREQEVYVKNHQLKMEIKIAEKFEKAYFFFFLIKI